MTVVSEQNEVEYAGDGTTTVFPVPFYFLEASHLIVTSKDADNDLTTELGSYDVKGAGNPAGGTVTMHVAPPSGTTLNITRSPPVTQLTDYVPNDPFAADSHERALDKLTMICQAVRGAVDDLEVRTIRVPRGEDLTELPQAEGRANKIVGFDNAGEVTLLNTTPSTIGPPVSAVKTMPGGITDGFPDLVDGDHVASPMVFSRYKFLKDSTIPVDGFDVRNHSEGRLWRPPPYAVPVHEGHFGPQGPFTPDHINGNISVHQAFEEWLAFIIEHDRVGCIPSGVFRFDQPVHHTFGTTSHAFGFTGTGPGTILLCSASNHDGIFRMDRTGDNPVHAIRAGHFQMRPEGSHAGIAFEWDNRGDGGFNANPRYRSAWLTDIQIASGPWDGISAKQYFDGGISLMRHRHPLLDNIWVEGLLRGGTIGTGQLGWKKVVTFDGSNAAVVSAASDLFTIANNKLRELTRVFYSNGGGTSIGGLTHGGRYIVAGVNYAAGTFHLSNGIAEAVRAEYIDITGLGTGTGHQFVENDVSEQSDRYLMDFGIRVDYTTAAVFDTCLTNCCRLGISNYADQDEGCRMIGTSANNVRTGMLIDREGFSPVIAMTQIWHAHYMDEGVVIAGCTNGTFENGQPAVQSAAQYGPQRDIYCCGAKGLLIDNGAYAGRDELFEEPGEDATAGAGTTRTLHELDADGQHPAQAQNLVTNGRFLEPASYGPWTLGVGWTVKDWTDDVADCDGSQTGNSDLSQDLMRPTAQGFPRLSWFDPNESDPLEPGTAKGQFLRLIFTMTRTAGTLTPLLCGTAGTTRSSAGTFDEVIRAIGDGTSTIIFRASNDFVGTVTDVFVVANRNPRNINGVVITRATWKFANRLMVIRDATPPPDHRVTDISFLEAAPNPEDLGFTTDPIFTDPNKVIQCTTIQESRVNRITSDADITLELFVDAETQIIDVDLSRNMTITLSTEHAFEGASFRIIRGPLGTGSFSINITGGGRLSWFGEWCVTRYLNGAWIVVDGAYGRRVFVTSTADGTGTGIIPESIAAQTHVDVTSSSATNRITLPSGGNTNRGKVLLLWVSGNGFDLVTPAGSNATINNVDADGAVQAAIPANSLSRVTAVSLNRWLLENISNVGAVSAPIVPS